MDLKELEDDYGDSTKVGAIGFHEIQKEPREAFLFLNPPPGQ